MSLVSQPIRTICNLTAAVVFATTALVLVDAVFGKSGLARAAGAALPQGSKSITLVSAGGEKLMIGTVDFTAGGGTDASGRTIEVNLDVPDFTDQFLSMRPFRCLPDSKEMWCHLAYPYALKNNITATDLTDLEYQLLFIFRSPDSYGIDAWNGLYFKLSAGEDGKISGNAHEVDLNILAVPPDDPSIRPINEGDLTTIEADSHRFARVEIE